MFCPKCGNELPGNAKFCPKCGNAVTMPQTAEEPSGDAQRIREYRKNEDSHDRRGSADPVSGGRSYRDHSSDDFDSRDSAPRRSSPHMAIGLLLGAIVLTAGILVYLVTGLLRSSTDTPKTGASASSPSGTTEEVTAAPSAQSDSSGTESAAQPAETASSPDDSSAQQDSEQTSVSTGETQGDSAASESGTAGDSTDSAANSAAQSAPEEDTVSYTYDSIRALVETTGASADTYFELITTDVSDYPVVKAYYSLRDSYGEAIILDSPTAGIKESVSGAAEIERTIRSIERLDGNEGLGMDILIDKSDSMEYDFPQVQSILNQFIRSIDFASGDAAEIISFDSYIMYMCSYTNQMDNLLNGISNMTTYGMTALYDALWTGVTNAGRRTGANCVIGFTDGADNESIHTYEEVINLANSLEIPIYLIGTSGADYTVLNYICESTGGRYWDINSIQDMNDILREIYRVQKNMYCIEYESDASSDPYASRTLSAALIDLNVHIGSVCEKVTFTPARRVEPVTHAQRYEIVKADVSWTEANDQCMAKGGHLATITSQAEMDELVSMAEQAGLKYVWIGGYTSVRGNTAYGHWLTGEPFNYTAWYPGEPSRNDSLDGEPEFYLMLWKVENEWSWNDQRNDVLHIGLDYFTGNIGYICEYEQ